VEELVKRIRTKLGSELPEAVQTELAELFFAAFTLVLVDARLINFPDASQIYFAMAIAFVAGFSERFGEDLAKVVAHRVPA
jgi:hypothetical protein